MAECYNVSQINFQMVSLLCDYVLVKWTIGSEMACLATLVAGGAVPAAFLGRHALAELHVEGGLTRH